MFDFQTKRCRPTWCVGCTTQRHPKPDSLPSSAWRYDATQICTQALPVIALLPASASSDWPSLCSVIFTCILLCVCVYTYVRENVCVYACGCVYVCVCMCVCVYMCVCVCAPICECMREAFRSVHYQVSTADFSLQLISSCHWGYFLYLCHCECWTIFHFVDWCLIICSYDSRFIICSKTQQVENKM